MSHRIALLAVAAGVAATALFSAAPAASAASTCVRTFIAPRVHDQSPFGITAGPDRTTWYSDGSTINMIAGYRTTTYVVPDADTASIGWMAWGGSSRIWFADRGNERLGTIGTDGHIREVQVPDGDNGAAVPQGIVVDRDAVWFTDQQNNRLGRLSLGHGATFTFYPVPSEFPLGLVRGGDGDLYFTERSVDKVARFDPTTGLFTEWTLPSGSFPNRLAVGPNGTVWFTSLFTSAVWNLSHGRLHEYDVKGGPVGITARGGRLYTAMFFSGHVDEISRSGSVVQTWRVPGGAAAGPLQIAASDGYLWTTGFTDVYRIDPSCS